MVDGNNNTKDIVNFMLTKPIVQQISNEYLKESNNKTNGIMTFSLVPSNSESVPMGIEINMTMNMEMKMN